MLTGKPAGGATKEKHISETPESENYKLRLKKISVADPGCLSRTPDLDF